MRLLLICTVAGLAFWGKGAGDEYAKMEKSLYVWGFSTQKKAGWIEDKQIVRNLAMFVKKHGYGKVYLFTTTIQWGWNRELRNNRFSKEKEMADLIAVLKKQGCEFHVMFYVNDDADDLSNYERVVDLVDTVAAFNRRNPRTPIMGLHGDQEPRSAESCDKLVKMYRLAKERIKRQRLKIKLGSSIKPKWLRQEGDRAPVLESLLEHLDEATIMAYSDNPKVMDKFAQMAFEMKNDNDSTIEIAVETGTAGAAPEETWSQEIREDKERFLAEMVKLDEKWKENKRYGGLVLHSYAQFFMLLYGEEPYSYGGSMKEFYRGE